MLREKTAQGTSIMVIVAAVIGLIILVVVIAMLTGKLGGFSSGAEKSGGDITKNCNGIDSSYTLRGINDCNNVGGSFVISKDSVKDVNIVCCTI